jgi:sucrose phosphorylase
MARVDNGPMLNAYPDSVGGKLSDIVEFLQNPEMKDVFQSFYILPSIFNTDLDRGFSVIDYSLNDMLAKDEDLKNLEELNIDLKLDFILNHASVLSEQVQDVIKNGEKSKYSDFFINWNKFWEGKGTMTDEGYIQPEPELIKNMFFRKPGLPILMVRMPDGKNVPYWNTFYQEVKYPRVDEQDLMRVAKLQYTSATALAELINSSLDDGKTPAEIDFGRFAGQKDAVVEYLESNRKYLGQMDLNIKSPLVWEHYDNTLKTLAGYGAKIVRLDAFAYAPKEPGEKNFLNEPGTWEVLEKVQRLADKYGVMLLPEIHASYEEKIYERVADKGYMTYDFFLPGLIIDAMEEKSGEKLAEWATEIYDKKIRVVNMLGCHDGIPLLDLKGLIPEERIGKLIDTVVERGGFVKNLHGQKNVYYQVNATYYSALGESDDKMLLARAIQMFMPGKPQVWYLDLFAGKNDYEAMERAGAGGHKEINRTNLSGDDIKSKLGEPVVQKQIELLRFRNTFPAFGFESEFAVEQNKSSLKMSWRKDGYEAVLDADMDTCRYAISATSPDGSKIEL